MFSLKFLFAFSLLVMSTQASLTASAAPSARKAAADMAAPIGITFQHVRLPGGGMGGGAITVFADDRGRTLYTSEQDKEPGKSSCTASCEASWLPVLATGRQDAPAHWSLIRREKSAQQWAYKGKPLYLSVKDEAPGEAKGHSVEQGWRVAAARYDEGLQLPPGLAAKEVAKLGGQVLVNEFNMPLYVQARGVASEKSACVRGRCANNFIPYVAGLLSRPTENFTVIERGDGIRQWAFQGQALYSYDGDIQAGDAKGVLQDGGWSAALLVRYFMPQDVKVVHTPFGGDTFATTKGQTLYVLNIATPNQGRSFRYVNLPNPTVGRALGPAACDIECVKTWRPLRAPQSARPAGLWDVVTRSDGTRQWAYRGFPVYTYAGDKTPGDMNGHDIFAYARADGDHVLPATLASAEGKLAVAAIPRGTRSFIWHVAAP